MTPTISAVATVIPCHRTLPSGEIDLEERLYEMDGRHVEWYRRSQRRVFITRILGALIILAGVATWLW